MLTTVELDNAVLERAQREAARERRSLSLVLNHALRAYFADLDARALREKPFELIVCGEPGGRFPSPEELEGL